MEFMNGECDGLNGCTRKYQINKKRVASCHQTFKRLSRFLAVVNDLGRPRKNKREETRAIVSVTAEMGAGPK